MKPKYFLLISGFLFFELINGESLQKSGVKPNNSPEVNRENLQKAIDKKVDFIGLDMAKETLKSIDSAGPAKN